MRALPGMLGRVRVEGEGHLEGWAYGLLELNLYPSGANPGSKACTASLFYPGGVHFLKTSFHPSQKDNHDQKGWVGTAEWAPLRVPGVLQTLASVMDNPHL